MVPEMDVIRQVAAGDTAALEVLYDHFNRAIYSLCLRIVHDTETAEEMTQEVFLRLWQSAASFDPERGRVSTWLLRIAHNLSLNEFRRRKSRPVVAQDIEWETLAATIPDCDEASNPAEAAWRDERTNVIRRALAALPSHQREAIELAFFGGLSQTEVAAALGEPLGTVKSRIRMGMHRLRELLAEEGITGVEEASSH